MYMNDTFFCDKIFGFRCGVKYRFGIKPIFEIEFDVLDKTISDQIQKILPIFDDPKYLFYISEYHFTTYYATGECYNYIWKKIDKDSLHGLLKMAI